MSIVSSVIADISRQNDGRRWVHETHTDHTGVTWVRDWLATAIENLDTALAAYAVQLASDLARVEAEDWISQIKVDGSLVTVSLVHATLATIRQALRAAYRDATRTEAVMIGDFLSTLTDGQLQTLFGLTAGQVTTLRTNKLTPAANAAATIRASTGA
jgi:hypothetical protein